MQSNRLLAETLIQEINRMKINNNQLPLKLQESISSGGWTRPGDGYSGRWRNQAKIKEFEKLFPRIEGPIPQFFNFEAMQRINEMWLNPTIADFYLGTFSQIYIPGKIDPMKTVIIGESEPDSPIALDFRTTVPRVIYFCDIDNESYWIEAFESVDILIDKLGLN
jgi:hypothetical protein